MRIAVDYLLAYDDIAAKERWIVDYFSDREVEPQPQTVLELTRDAWLGIAAAIRTRINDGSFGYRYPRPCDDGTVPIGTDPDSFWGAIAGDIPALGAEHSALDRSEPPPLHAVMDLIEFCWHSVAQPAKFEYHQFMKHHHLKFDVDAGREQFRTVINQVFGRNLMAYELTQKGTVHRLLPEPVSEIVNTQYQTGDSELDEMLDRARQKLLSPDDVERRESLEVLWDAWERMKTIGGADKKTGISDLLDDAARSKESQFRDYLKQEARTLTEIGNRFRIRHSETGQERLEVSEHVDYFACRMFSFVFLVLRKYIRNSAAESAQADSIDDVDIPF